MRSRLSLLLFVSLAAPAAGPLTLEQAARLALDKNPAAEASASKVKAAQARIDQTRGGYLPKVNYQESFATSNNPVFVFGSLLTQRQFTEKNFALDALNRPDFLNNFQSQLVVDQVVYDAGQTRWQRQGARLGSDVVKEDDRLTKMRLVAGVARAYLDAQLAAEGVKVAREAVRSAEADLARAEAVRSAGMATEADVLSVRVHLAAVKEQEIRRGYDLQVARAALNQALGLPLDEPHELTTALAAAPLSGLAVADQEGLALKSRPESRQTELAAQLAENQVSAARASYLPQVSLRGVFEADRQRFVTRAGSNWFFGATLRWNLFNGYADRARIAEASETLAGARAQRKYYDSAIRLEVRKAMADAQAARERIDVTSSAVSQAEESLRITRNRYEAGLATITDLLRNETALLEVRTRRLAAVHDQRLAVVALEMARGNLTEDSDVLK
jgi:outer membrane protein